MKNFAIQDKNIGLILCIIKADDAKKAFQSFKNEMGEVEEDELITTEIPEHLCKWLDPFSGDDQTAIDALGFFKTHEVWFPETHAIIYVGKKTETRFKAHSYAPERAIIKIGSYDECLNTLRDFAEEDLTEEEMEEIFYDDWYEKDGNKFKVVSIPEESEDHENMPLYINSSRLSYLI